ncbi:MAG TPA: hypothetical protein VGK99_22710 [Acidobacteriota bacterium]|jgi:hypothetical protein
MVTVDGSAIGLGLALQALLLWQCLKVGHWRNYPLFFSYLVYTFLRTIALVIFRGLKHPAYPLIYWDTNVGAILLRFGVAFEVFRHIFVRESALGKIAGRAVVLVLVVFAAAFFLLSNQPGTFFPDLERKSGLAVVSILAVMLVMARYYSVPVSLNVWGMAVGMGLFCSISVANFATFDLIRSSFPFWRLVSAFSFSAMMLIWIWALWCYVPDPQPKVLRESLAQDALAMWKRSWDHFRPNIRRAIGL